MLTTPFGNVTVYLDGKELSPKVRRILPEKGLSRNVKEAYRLSWYYEPDGKEHTLSCQLACGQALVMGEGGDRLEMTSFFVDGGKLSIGVEGDFGDPPAFDYDYTGSSIENGIELTLNTETKARDFVFGVAWMDECDDPEDLQTWFAADPTVEAEDWPKA